MGTTWTMKVVRENEVPSVRIARLAEEALALVVAQMSPWEPESDLSRYRQAEAGTWVSFADESYGVLAQSLEISTLSNGAYDPKVGEVIDLLGFGPSEPIMMDWNQIEQVLSEVDRYAVLLDPEGKRVFQPGGCQLDLCSIAKGYAVDLIADRLKAEGLNHFFIEIGGEVRGEGCKPDGQPWWCALQRSMGTECLLPETVAAMCRLSVATSGNCLRKRQLGGLEIGHIVSPKEDIRLEEGLLSVSVFDPSCMVADAFATALYAMGSARGLRLAERLGLAVLFVRKGAKGFEEVWTSTFDRMMEA